jgi:hypothetical protein
VLAAIAAVTTVTAGACSGKPRTEEAAPSVSPRGDATAADPAGSPGDAGSALAGDAGSPADAGSPSSGDAGAVDSVDSVDSHRLATSGDLQIKVEWPDVPAVARSSPGRTSCNTARTPSVAPTTTWGVPGALVIIAGASPALAAAHITLADCAFTPRVAIGGSLAITSAADRPAKLVLRKRGSAAAPAQLTAGDPIQVMLPIAGHTVTTVLDPGAIYSLETDEADPEVAFVAAVAGGYVSDSGGLVTSHGLAVGRHAVTAWLPPRAGQPARTGHATATVAGGELAELTVTLTP